VSLGPWRAPRSCVEPSERLLPIVALSATVGKRVPPLTLLLRAPRAETLKSTPNAVRRPPRQGRPPLSTFRAPSIAEWSVPGLRRVRSCCRSRDFAASIRPPTLFRRALPKKRWLDGRYRGLITRGRSRRASLDDFCNPCDPQARFPRDRWIPCFHRPRPRSRAGKSRCARLAARRSRCGGVSIGAPPRFGTELSSARRLPRHGSWSVGDWHTSSVLDFGRS
jgi:hypothetical protein